MDVEESRHEQTATLRSARRPPRRRAGRPWSREQVMEALLEWVREVGSAPYAYEWEPGVARRLGRENTAGVQKWIREHPRWPSRSSATEHWGSWRALLSAAGLPSAPPLTMPLSERLEIAESMRGYGAGVVADIIGVTPGTVRTYWRAGICPSCGGPKVSEHANVCANCLDRRRTQRLARESVIAAIRLWERETGDPPTMTLWVAGSGKWDTEFPRWPTLADVRVAFGSWNAAIAAAGYSPRFERWSREAIIAAAQRWSSMHGRSPTRADWHKMPDDRSHPTERPVTRAFASWNAMLDAAGLQVIHGRWTREEILDALSIWIAEHGRVPTSEDWKAADPQRPHPTPTCAADHFGSWSAMLIAGGVKPHYRAWTRERILTACAAFEERHQRPIRSSDLNGKDDLPWLVTVHKHLGDIAALRDALKAARSSA